MKNNLKLLTVLFLFALMSCSSDDSNSNKISNQTLQGKVFGEDFTAVGGKAFTSGDNISVNITNEVVGCDETIIDYDLYISTYVTPKVGVYESINVVFQKDGEIPLNFFGGTVEVTALTDDEITVKILADSSSDKMIEGTFTVPVCD